MAINRRLCVLTCKEIRLTWHKNARIVSLSCRVKSSSFRPPVAILKMYTFKDHESNIAFFFQSQSLNRKSEITITFNNFYPSHMIFWYFFCLYIVAIIPYIIFIEQTYSSNTNIKVTETSINMSIRVFKNRFKWVIHQLFHLIIYYFTIKRKMIYYWSQKWSEVEYNKGWEYNQQEKTRKHHKINQQNNQT